MGKFMDFVKLFKQGSWIKSAKKFVGDNSKLSALALEAMRYAKEKKSLDDVKDDILLLCNYVKDIATGRYKGYKTWNLTVIIAALLYIISPVDVIPDFLIGGFVDDIGIIAWALGKMSSELDAYKRSMLSY